jgi:K+ transporter
MRFFKTKLARYLLAFFVIINLALIVIYYTNQSFLEPYTEVFLALMLEPIILFLVMSIYENRFELISEEKARLKLSSDDLVKKYHLEKMLQYQGRVFPYQATFIPSNLLSLNRIIVLHKNHRFIPPVYISSHSKEIMNANKLSYNSLTVRLNNFYFSSAGDLTLETEFSDYFSHSCSVRAPMTQFQA